MTRISQPHCLVCPRSGPQSYPGIEHSGGACKRKMSNLISRFKAPFQSIPNNHFSLPNVFRSVASVASVPENLFGTDTSTSIVWHGRTAALNPRSGIEHYNAKQSCPFFAVPQFPCHPCHPCRRIFLPRVTRISQLRLFGMPATRVSIPRRGLRNGKGVNAGNETSRFLR